MTACRKAGICRGTPWQQHPVAAALWLRRQLEGLGSRGTGQAGTGRGEQRAGTRALVDGARARCSISSCPNCTSLLRADVTPEAKEWSSLAQPCSSQTVPISQGLEELSSALPAGSSQWRLLERNQRGRQYLCSWLPTAASPAAVVPPTPPALAAMRDRRHFFHSPSLQGPGEVPLSHAAQGLVEGQSQKTESSLIYQGSFNTSLPLWLTAGFLLWTYSNLAQIHISFFLSGNAKLSRHSPRYHLSVLWASSAFVTTWRCTECCQCKLARKVNIKTGRET